MHVYIYLFIYLFIYVFVYVFMYLCIYLCIYLFIYLYMCRRSVGRNFTPIFMKFGTNVYFINISAKFVNQQNRMTGSTLLGGRNPQKSGFKLIKNTFFNRFLRKSKLNLPLVSPICKPKISMIRSLISKLRPKNKKFTLKLC